MAKGKQIKLIDDSIDNPTAVAADRLVELMDEKKELEEQIVKQEERVVLLMKKNDRVVFVHGGRRFNLKSSEPKERLVVKVEKEKKIRGITLSGVADGADNVEPQKEGDKKGRARNSKLNNKSLKLHGEK